MFPCFCFLFGRPSTSSAPLHHAPKSMRPPAQRPGPTSWPFRLSNKAPARCELSILYLFCCRVLQRHSVYMAGLRRHRVVLVEDLSGAAQHLLKLGFAGLDLLGTRGLARSGASQQVKRPRKRTQALHKSCFSNEIRVRQNQRKFNANSTHIQRKFNARLSMVKNTKNTVFSCIFNSNSMQFQCTFNANSTHFQCKFNTPSDPHNFLPATLKPE